MKTSSQSDFKKKDQRHIKHLKLNGLQPKTMDTYARLEGAIEYLPPKAHKEWAWNNFPVWRPDLVCIGSF